MSEHVFEPDYISKPGDSVRDFLEEYNIRLETFAHAMGMDMLNLDTWLNNDVSWTNEEIQKLSMFSKTPVRFWKNRHDRYQQQVLRDNAKTFQTLFEPD